jgi:hypothetical protein
LRGGFIFHAGAARRADGGYQHTAGAAGWWRAR